MNKLKNNELKNIKGGFGFWAVTGIIAGCTFICGVIDGIVNPIKCGRNN